MGSLIHPTEAEVRERFNKEVEEALKTPTKQMIALAKLDVIKEWDKQGKRVDNLGESFMDLLEAAYNRKQ